jgi:hypothetical protein
MNNNHVVLITSAVYSNYGVFTPQQRIQQTLETAESARKYIPNSTIILIDNSKIDVQQDNSPEFTALLDAVDYYIDNSDDADIQHFHNNVQNYDIGKNSMECLGMFKALNYITSDAEIMGKITSASRIFKLSGRYTVTDKFDVNKFDNDQTVNKYVFKQRQPSWIPQADTDVDHLLQTRLWSFTPSLFMDTISLFKQIIENMFATFNKQKYIDVEHSMFKFIPADKLVELESVGLIGKIAPNGMVVVD